MVCCLWHSAVAVIDKNRVTKSSCSKCLFCIGQKCVEVYGHASALSITALKDLHTVVCRKSICAAQPTAKICLLGSVKK